MLLSALLESIYCVQTEYLTKLIKRQNIRKKAQETINSSLTNMIYRLSHFALIAVPYLLKRAIG